MDETSIRKRHDYVTVVSDKEGDKVLHVADERTKESLLGHYETRSNEQKEAIERAYIRVELMHDLAGRSGVHPVLGLQTALFSPLRNFQKA